MGFVIYLYTCEVMAERLEPGERVIWSTRPNPWTAAGRFAFPLIFLPAVVGFILHSALKSLAHPKPNTLHPALILAILSWFVFTGLFFWWRALILVRRCWATAYALTNRRVLVVAGNETLSYGPAELTDIWRSGGKEHGSLNFWGRAWRAKQVWARYPHGLFGIDEPDSVKALIQETLVKPYIKGKIE